MSTNSGSGSFGRHLGKAGQVNVARLPPVQRSAGKRTLHKETGGHLAGATIAEIFVTFILDRDRDAAAVFCDGDGIRLAAQIAACQFLAGVHIDSGKVTRRLDVGG